MASRPVIALALLATLAGCAGVPGESSEDKYGRMLVAPGKYILYNCDELATQASGTVARIRELERLMAKADVDATGGFVSAIAYRPEYLEKRGDLNELRNTAVEKKCKPIPALEVPAAHPPAGAAR